MHTARGISPASLAAASVTGMAAMPAVIAMSGPDVPTGAVFAMSWPVFGVIGALLLDRDDRLRLGWALVAVAVVPLVVAAVALGSPEPSFWRAYEEVWLDLVVALVVLSVGVLSWAHGVAPERLVRRRLIWLVLWGAVLVAAISATAAAGAALPTATVTSVGLLLLAGLVLVLVTTGNLRPVDEPLRDAGLAVGAVACAAASALAVRWVARAVGAPHADLTALVVAVASAGLLAPATLRVRRSLVERRYGTGVLTPADVAAITADLRRDTDPRALAGKAAAMVAAASRHPDVRLVLGDDPPDREPGWLVHPLDVGGDRVGFLMLRSQHPEGPEPRQAERVHQLLPTVALVARAVGLAVEAEHARQDVARQREAERARILGDLHDGLGPVLAGMSMRVHAQLRNAPSALLAALADDLAECRGDLRRIVSGLAPTALSDEDLPSALQRLVSSFGGGRPALLLTTTIEEPLDPEVSIAVYRCVAEGITNAVRHAAAEQVRVDVATRDGQVLVEVSDDGRGGVVVPGVGLTSLRRRAEDLGGRLELHAGVTGVRMCVQLPTSRAAA